MCANKKKRPGSTTDLPNHTNKGSGITNSNQGSGTNTTEGSSNTSIGGSDTTSGKGSGNNNNEGSSNTAIGRSRSPGKGYRKSTRKKCNNDTDCNKGLGRIDL